VSWLAEDVPAFGYRLFRLGRIEGRLQVNQPTETHRPIENEWFRIDVDPATGDIEKIVDVRSGYQYLAGPGNEIAARHETEPNLEGMVNITGEDETTGSNVSPTALAWESTELYERVTSTRDFLGCTVVREVTLYRGIARVHCRTTFKQFAGGDVLVSVRFPAALAGEGQLVYETPFAMTERDRSYHCAQTVVDIHDDRHGIALANTGSAGYFPFGNTLDLILFRSLANFPDYYGPLAAEQGDQTYEYVLIPHDGDWREGNAVAAGHAVNTPLTVHYAGRRAGQRGNAASFLSAQPDNVRITAVKRSYDGNALVLRLWESDGKPCDATININVPFAGAWNATMEETLLGPLPVSGNTICVPLRAWQIATVVVGTGAGVQTA
jgi:alpha-mannosidase